MASSSYAIKEEDQDYEEDEEEVTGETVALALQRLVKHVQCERQAYVKGRMQSNKERLKGFTANLLGLDIERKLVWERKEPSSFFSLCMKNRQALGTSNGSDSYGERDNRLATQDSGSLDKPMAIIFGCQTGGKTAVRPIKLRKVENVPPYTTWIYLDRNQRMTEDQSVVGRRRIYYDSDGNETLIASDSEEEDPGDDDDKEESRHDFIKGEDSLVWMTIQELGLKRLVLNELSEVLDIKPEEIEARYEFLLKESAKNGLVSKNLGENPSAGKLSSQGRRKPSALELAQEMANEAKEYVRGILGCNQLETKKETLDDGRADLALLASNRCSLPEILEDDKNEPKDLLTAMDSFDNLFCRRCLVFDCRLHGCSQALVHPTERQQPWNGPEDAIPIPCSQNCYLLTEPNHMPQTRLHTETLVREDAQGAAQEPSESPEQDKTLTVTQEDELGASQILVKRSRMLSMEMSCSSETQVWAVSTVHEPGAAQQAGHNGLMISEQSEVVLKEKKLERRSSATRKSLSRRVKRSCSRGDISYFLKPQLSQEEPNLSPESESQDFPRDDSVSLKEEGSSYFDKSNKLREVGQSKLAGKRSRVARDDENEETDQGEDGNLRESEATVGKVAVVSVPEVLNYKEGRDDAEVQSDTAKAKVGVGWSELEMGLYEKGLQIFGRNSCMIARNLLQGCKTCAEVAKYTQELDSAGHSVRRVADSLDIEAATRARLYGGRRKGRVRKLKYTWKSVVHPLIRKRMANGKDQPCRQYTPCNCLYTCGKQCPCLLNGTCCEKYCGCSKSCKNRFRGCHCAKSQCCSRQCPCFAAGRECDPDVCRNCWVGCGDGTLGGPPPRGDNYACHNMKLMLKQQQRVLLGRSDVAGWGAFLKNPVAKHEYLGEYTGELISHREADKRGKIYDRENSSFLFNLNDQYVLDACRKGDKLKFANHSPQPNCYAKVIMVSGDHRVGIFAKEKITAGEELFYDYRYEPDRAPVWAKKPDDPNHKRDDMPSTSGRAQKAA